MVIRAKFPGKCQKCGRRIEAGEQVEWQKGRGIQHIECPAEKASAPVQAPQKSAEQPMEKQIQAKYPGRCSKCGIKIDAGEWVYYYTCTRTIRHCECPEGVRNAHTVRGQRPVGTMVQKDGLWLVVERVQSQYLGDEAMSVGGDEDGYVHISYCREATDEEIAAHQAQREAQKQQRTAERRMEEAAEEIRQHGEVPDAWQEPAGQQGDIDPQNAYGGGSWFVVGEEWLWYVRNNAMDGDCWDRNNVRTGGAGAIGWRVPVEEYRELADEILELGGIR